jgi:hypothetical protein
MHITTKSGEPKIEDIICFFWVWTMKAYRLWCVAKGDENAMEKSKIFEMAIRETDEKQQSTSARETSGGR